jgi:protein-tyrosine phosphatase
MARVENPRSVESAGFILPGRQPPLTALEVSADRGFDLSGHRSRAVTEQMAREAAVILVMERWQKRKLLSMIPRLDAPVLMLGDLDPGPIERRAIQDPIDKPRAVFERVFSRIDACCADLVAYGSYSPRS